MSDEQPKRLKILLGCYACDPNYGSEPGMGWNFVKNIAKFHDVHAIVEKNEFEENLTKYSLEHPEEVKNITFHYIPRVHHNTLRKIWPPSYYWFYRKWQKQAYQYALELDRKENFDVVHQITISGFREPGYLWKLGKPYIWGPIGGLTDTPWCLMSSLGLAGGIHFTFRNCINFFHKRWGFKARATAKHSHTILTSTTTAVNEIKKFWKRDATLMSEVGLETHHPIFNHSIHLPGTTFHVCWAGDHIPRKALDLLLRAVPYCKEKVHIHVLSKGPRSNAWKKLAHKLGINDCVTFHGYLPRNEAFRVMSESHVFCITSIREDTSTVVFEAFRYGLPIIALNHCGFASVINDTCGIKIPIQSRKQVISDYAKHIDYLATHEDVRQKLSAGAVERCKSFTWEHKITMLNQIYLNAYTTSGINQKKLHQQYPTQLDSRFLSPV